MHKRIATGLFVLIFILGVAIVFYHQYTDIQQLKQEAAEAEKLLEEQHKGVAENKPPRPAREGYKWEWHGDHWHEMPVAQSDSPHAPTEQPVQNEPLQVFEPEPAQVPSTRTEGIYKEGLNGQMLYYPPHPPFETYAHLLKDPEATIRKNAKIIVENSDPQAVKQAWKELNLLHIEINKGYFGVKWDSEGVRLGRLEREVLWKPLEEAGRVVTSSVPIVEPISTPEGGENR